MWFPHDWKQLFVNFRKILASNGRFFKLSKSSLNTSDFSLLNFMSHFTIANCSNYASFVNNQRNVVPLNPAAIVIPVILYIFRLLNYNFNVNKIPIKLFTLLIGTVTLLKFTRLFPSRTHDFPVKKYNLTKTIYVK